MGLAVKHRHLPFSISASAHFFIDYLHSDLNVPKNSVNRECLRHLWKNMKKNDFTCELYFKNTWAAAKSFTIDKFNYFMGKIEEKDPSALAWLDDNHPYVWSRSKFFENCMVDYINNNLSESFNSWVSKTKDLYL